MRIKTNKLNYHIIPEALESSFDFFKISTSDQYIKSGATVLDFPLLANNVQSILFERGKSFHVMMKKSDMNFRLLKKVLSESKEGHSLTIAKSKFTDIEEYIVLQLLFNGLGSADNPILRFNNLTGKLYCFHPEWLIHGSKSDTEMIWKVPCLEIKISKDFILSINVHTFTSELLKKKITFGKKKFEDYPQYILSNKNTLRRKLNNDSAPGFILRQENNKKTEIPFMDIQNLDKFNQSKMGILCGVIQSFNQKYKELANVEFAEIDDAEFINHSKKEDAVQHTIITDFLSQQGIRIVDRINDRYSEECCRKIASMLFMKYGINAKIGKRLVKNALNIELIHNVAYYINADDPHSDKDSGYVVQHITLEDFNFNSNFALDTVIHEAIIKSDVSNGRITLFDWSSYQLENISFGIKEVINDEERYFFIDISKDGSFSFSEQEYDMFTMNEYYRCVQIFEDAQTTGDNVKGIIHDNNGSINVIKDTNWFTIPDIDSIFEELSKGNTYLRGNEYRNTHLAASLDIKSFHLNGDDGLYYYVGDIGEGMRTKIQHAANIRKVECYENAPDLFSELLPMMNVTFVRNGQLTVLPFPFKYLNEYIKMKYK